MGNQHSGGVEFCSKGQLYTDRGEMTRFKLDPEYRVGYNISTKPTFQVQRIQKAHQQMAPQQQNQEDVVEIPLSGPGKFKLPVSFFETEDRAEVAEKRKPSFNVYISCLDKEEELCSAAKIPKVNQEVEGEMVDFYKDDYTVIEGLFGNVIINEKGLVLYTDIYGEQHCEEYERDEIGKIFPMGISFGGLTKSIWFEDAAARNEAFEAMLSVPPSYKAVMANPAKYAIMEADACEVVDDDNMKVFEGINNTNVIVHSDNIVLYTDINKKKHCITYNKHNIRKCFPNGICYGGLPKAIWFTDQMERDLCFMLMQWNMEDESNEMPEEPTAQSFTALYGNVILHTDSQIEFTSFAGDRLKSFYEPSDIREIFPQGISFGRLPKTIWFRDDGEREKCIEAMRKM